MRVLTVNVGSSSVKLNLLDHDDTVMAHAELATGAGEREGERLRAAVSAMPVPEAVGHRLVHGGPDFTDPVVIDDKVTERLGALTDLAPLHQSVALLAAGEIGQVLPDVPAVACFDTGFHARLPAPAATYALPAAWRQRYGLRRYGFHGLSCGYAMRRAGQMLNADTAELRMVICHLGAGASVTAVAGGRSVDTTMGFTPVEGLVMATRSGSVDPGMLVWMIKHGTPATEIADGLEHGSGLLGLCGHADLREVQAAAERGEGDAELALEVYLHRLRAEVAAMVAALGGLDVLVFTGGVGEHDQSVRRRTTEGLAYLGLGIDLDRNERVNGDADISRPGRPVRTLVITAREDLEIASQVRALLSGRVHEG